MPDVVDSALVSLAADGDEIITLDRDGFEKLAMSAGRHIELLRP